MKLNFPSLKTDPFRKGIKLTMATSLDNACPVSAMEEYLPGNTHRPSQAPQLCIGDLEQKEFPQEYVVHKL